jgi:peptidoglycan hydrolase FlgJ
MGSFALADTASVTARDAATQFIRGATAKPQTPQAKARAAAEDFEAVFLNSMFSEMSTGVDGKGTFDGPGAAIWRSMLTDQYARSFAKAGGVGIANDVYRSLLAQQEASMK